MFTITATAYELTVWPRNSSNKIKFEMEIFNFNEDYRMPTLLRVMGVQRFKNGSCHKNSYIKNVIFFDLQVITSL